MFLETFRHSLEWQQPTDGLCKFVINEIRITMGIDLKNVHGIKNKKKRKNVKNYNYYTILLCIVFSAYLTAIYIRMLSSYYFAKSPKVVKLQLFMCRGNILQI